VDVTVINFQSACGFVDFVLENHAAILIGDTGLAIDELEIYGEKMDELLIMQFEY
jgi:hypothetical protein